jgi:heavy metal sensor kinase
LEWNLMPGEVDPDQRPNTEWETTILWPRAIPYQLQRGNDSAYFIVWRPDGSILKQSDVPSIVMSDLNRQLQNQIRNRLQFDRYAWQHRGPWREVYIRGSRESLICVGRSVIGEQSRTSRLTVSLAVTGLSILVLGALGGWWTINRALTPLQEMSNTARGINANRLAQRMDLKGVDSEVSELGTVLNEMLDRLGESINQQKRFTADASHELRTPLSVILSSSELALSKPRSSEEYRDHLEKCQRAAIRMQNLVESLLILARVDATPSVESYKKVDLEQVIDDSIRLLEPLAAESRIKVVNEVSTCFVLGDASQLSQAFVNLISNAIKYNSLGGSVRIQSTSEASKILIEITDTGIGIPENDLPHVFERFYRVDQARSRLQGGTGLGLSITERIIVAHGGEIGVRSKVDEGSTFWIRMNNYDNQPKEF